LFRFYGKNGIEATIINNIMKPESNSAASSSSSASSSTTPSPSGKRARDPEDEIYLDNLHSHKRYLSEVGSFFFVFCFYFIFLIFFYILFIAPGVFVLSCY